MIFYCISVRAVRVSGWFGAKVEWVVLHFRVLTVARIVVVNCAYATANRVGKISHWTTSNQWRVCLGHLGKKKQTFYVQVGRARVEMDGRE